jgi:predicted DNA-binding transcriptional regulator AlpA
MSPTIPIQKEALSPDEFMASFGLGRTTFYRLVQGGSQIRKVGIRSLVLRSDIDAWLASLPTTVSGGRPTKAAVEAKRAAVQS